jgi:hypothetical protein
LIGQDVKIGEQVIFIDYDKGEESPNGSESNIKDC